jgi:hypothetical protein
MAGYVLRGRRLAPARENARLTLRQSSPVANERGLSEARILINLKEISDLVTVGGVGFRCLDYYWFL